MIRLLKSLNHFRKIRPAEEKDRLRHVFNTMAAMGSKRYDSTRDKYLNNPKFVELVLSEPTLSDQISDIKTLKKMDKDSFGYAMYEYLADDGIDHAKFLMEYETAGLQARDGGLYEAYNNRERDLHDVIHVLFGYERTRFGEAATVVTHYWQGGSSGFAVMMFAGLVRYLFVRPRHFFTVSKAVFNVWRRQRGVELRSYPIEQSFHKPLQQIRKELGVLPKSPTLKLVLAKTRWKD